MSLNYSDNFEEYDLTKDDIYTATNGTNASESHPPTNVIRTSDLKYNIHHEKTHVVNNLSQYLDFGATVHGRAANVHGLSIPSGYACNSSTSFTSDSSCNDIELCGTSDMNRSRRTNSITSISSSSNITSNIRSDSGSGSNESNMDLLNFRSINSNSAVTNSFSSDIVVGVIDTAGTATKSVLNNAMHQKLAQFLIAKVVAGNSHTRNTNVRVLSSEPDTRIHLHVMELLKKKNAATVEGIFI